MKQHTSVANGKGAAVTKAGFVFAPWYLLMLPLFFVVHGWRENFYDIPLRDLVPLLAIYLCVALILGGLSWLFFRRVDKSALFATFLLSIHFFFGALQDSLGESSLLHSLARYSYLLSFIGIAILAIAVFLRMTKRRLRRPGLYLNTLLLILILVDVVHMIGMPVSRTGRGSVSADGLNKPICDTCTHPDIYFILCDEFASSRSLLESWGYDNRQFDTALTRRGFHVIPGSHSNYNFTPFSMASILNMGYLEGIDSSRSMTSADYANMVALIRKNRVAEVLSSAGYEIVNYSIFDLDGRPSEVNQFYVPLRTRLITQQTLLNRMWKDLGYMLVAGRFRVPWIAEPKVFEQMNNNELFIAKTGDIAACVSDKPRFIYTHLYMPHIPYYFDSSGKRRDAALFADDYIHEPAEPYLGSVTYTSKRMIPLVDSILARSARPPVIILMGDHGFRKPTPAGNKDYFRDMNAVWLPGGDYRAFNDSMSTVNEFRIILNSVFGENNRLLKDSTILLRDK